MMMRLNTEDRVKMWESPGKLEKAKYCEQEFVFPAVGTCPNKKGSYSSTWSSYFFGKRKGIERLLSEDG